VKNIDEKYGPSVYVSLEGKCYTKKNLTKYVTQMVTIVKCTHKRKAGNTKLRILLSMVIINGDTFLGCDLIEGYMM